MDDATSQGDLEEMIDAFISHVILGEVMVVLALCAAALAKYLRSGNGGGND